MEERRCGGCLWFIPASYDWYNGGWDAPECRHPDEKVRAFQYLKSFPFKNGCKYKKTVYEKQTEDSEWV